ncbi:hypothetical protein NMG60_11036957 [Bertholletia excelsa]
MASSPHDQFDRCFQDWIAQQIRDLEELLSADQHDAEQLRAAYRSEHPTLRGLDGCRPSLAMRLVYSICGSEMEARLSKYLEVERKGDLGQISALELSLINGLHCRIIREEDKLSNQMASLQEDLADEPLATLAKNQSRAHALALARVVGEADNLRLATLKELIDILTPLQALDLLVASKKLHLSLHEGAKTREQVTANP